MRLWKMLVGDIAPPGLAGLQLRDHMRLLCNAFFNVENWLRASLNCNYLLVLV